MLLEIETFIALLGGAMGLLAATGQLLIPDKRSENYNLAALSFALGLLLFQNVAVFTGYCINNQWTLVYHMTLIWIQAPLLYLAYFYLTNTEDKYPDRIYRFFIPSIIAFLLDTVSIIAYLAGYLPNLLWIFHDDTASWLGIKKYLLMAGTLQIIIYLIVFLLKMLPAWKFSERNSILTVTISYSFSSLIATIILILGYTTVNVLYLKTAALIAAVGLIIIYPLGQRYHRFFQILRTEVKKEKYKKSLLEGKDVTPIMSQLVQLMEEQKLYRDENLTLKNLADCVAMTPHQLSQLLNDRLNTNFSSFVNRYRITEAEQILIDKPDRPVLAMAFDVGFNNKTSFYDAFSKFNGISPHKFRKDRCNS
jgi:AraC-like DNA-binding protein